VSQVRDGVVEAPALAGEIAGDLLGIGQNGADRVGVVVVQDDQQALAGLVEGGHGQAQRRVQPVHQRGLHRDHRMATAGRLVERRSLAAAAGQLQ
jgi:hypothetical protein